MGEAPPWGDTGPMKELGSWSFKRDVGGAESQHVGEMLHCSSC